MSIILQTLFFKINDSQVNAVHITEIPVKTTCFSLLFRQTVFFLFVEIMIPRHHLHHPKKKNKKKLKHQKTPRLTNRSHGWIRTTSGICFPFELINQEMSVLVRSRSRATLSSVSTWIRDCSSVF